MTISDLFIASILYFDKPMTYRLNSCISQFFYLYFTAAETSREHILDKFESPVRLTLESGHFVTYNQTLSRLMDFLSKDDFEQPA